MSRRIAAGGTSEILEWGEDRVLKLFTRAYQYAVDMEAERARAVHEAGVPSPAVVELIEVEGRRGIVYERVDGPLLLAAVPAEGIEAVARRLADIHLELHEYEVPALPSRRELIESAPLDEATRAEFLARLESLPGGSAVFHGDMHPANVILSARGPVLIDWVNACRAHPALDVARSYVLMRYQGLEVDRTGRRARMAEAYRDAYLAAGTLDHLDYEAGLSSSAASLLRAQPANPHRDELRRLAGRR